MGALDENDLASRCGEGARKGNAGLPTANNGRFSFNLRHYLGSRLAWCGPHAAAAFDHNDGHPWLLLLAEYPAVTPRPAQRNPIGRRQSSAEESHHRNFLRLEACVWVGQFGVRPSFQCFKQGAIEIPVENRRVDVAFAAYRRRVAERFGDRLNGLHHIALRLRLAGRSFPARAAPERPNWFQPRFENPWR